MTYKLGSLFDGSGGFPLAGILCGIEPVWAAEVEPYPIAVTRSRFPNMKHLGSVTEVHGGEIEPVDIITFGSPCQDLSVAGKRAGLKHEANGDEETTRSGLFMEAVRIIKEMREATNGEYPSFALWENVPGAFSSQKGEDFRVVLEELIRIVEPNASMPEVPKAGWAYADSYVGDGWSLAYRVFDAQYWGVPQRRRRIHLVLDLRGERAREVLFEREGVRGYFAQSRTPWQEIASNPSGSPASDDREGETADSGAGRGLDAVGFLRQLSGVEAQIEVSPTLMAAAGMSGNNKPCVAYSFDSLASNSMKSKNPHSGCREVEVAKTLDTTDPNPSKNQGGIAVVEPVAYTMQDRAGKPGGGKGPLVQENRATSLRTSNYQYVFQPTGLIDSIGGQAEHGWVGDVAPTLKACHYKFAPCVTVAAGFCTEHSAKARGVGYQEEVAPTLRAGVTPAAMYATFDARGNRDGETVSTITGDHENRVTDYTSVVCEPMLGSGKKVTGCLMASGYEKLGAQEMFSGDYTVVEPVVYDGANVTSPVNASNPSPGDPCHTLSTDSRNYAVYCLQGNGIDRADTAGCNGKGWKEDTCYTLNTIDRPAVAYTMQGFGDYKDCGVASGLKARDYKDATDLVCGVDCRNLTESPELYQTLQAKPNGGQSLNYSGAVRVQYIVRRLTPTECARLQGFADRHGHIDHKDAFTEKEYRFWLNVRNTHAAINGKQVKDYTEAQMLKWYNGLHTDSAEYKLWGNGIALPPALYCLQGMADVLNTREEGDDWLL
ncbi:MAG: DNA cytosine methyltransferase [Akkermansia sp.]|nr:DNA cytosine methyltransferase [Akkermansia sp.]